ncbi:uncharacterized protein LOC115579115 [Sparus aurata]|uniref:uncharacterized protein LOC115579115 n=1 Tax=Sparus aurata TaxID=8175 RepID=UPI0011C0FD6B|nr:uncharacterized protein LOC115579115 [Sparus aurata]
MEKAAVEFMKDDHFRSSAFLIIDEMVELSRRRPSVLVDEILHSIFFLGEINDPRYTPKHIVSDDEMFKALRDHYPRPFECCSSQLPKRSPFSCVLDMIVQLTGQQNENQIINRLRQLIKRLGASNDLVSSTVCVTQKNTAEDSVRYYGVSMSTSGRNPGRIMVAASCLSTWDRYVADAVMSYYPSKKRKSYFDGTIRLPEQVRCQGFSLRQVKQMDPCRSCGNLFGLTTSEKQVWSYGHCAEAESISNLLKKENEMRELVQQTSHLNTDENRQKAKNSVSKELSHYLSMVEFKWDKEFYIPREAAEDQE